MLRDARANQAMMAVCPRCHGNVLQRTVYDDKRRFVEAQCLQCSRSPDEVHPEPPADLRGGSQPGFHVRVKANLVPKK